MKSPFILPAWSPRVKPFLLRRLYESDAAGRLDEELLDDVGWALYSRWGCPKSRGAAALFPACAGERIAAPLHIWPLRLTNERFWTAAARQGRVRCPVCQAVVPRGEKPRDLMRCPSCGWTCTYKAYMDTIKNQQLDGGPEVLALFSEYIQAFPQAKEPAQKMLLIDQLIHGFHHFLSSGRTRRPVGVNLIDGHLEFVIEFLDRLSCGPGSTPGLEQSQSDWREKVYNRVGKKMRLW